LFHKLNITLHRHDKIALLGNNGAGKSSLLKIMAQQLAPSTGTVTSDSRAYYIPQHIGQYNDLTIAQALQAGEKLRALQDILAGHATEENLALLDNDWLLEDRCREALAHWDIGTAGLGTRMASLSGGQKTKVFLAGIAVHQPSIVLLDEPSNHLDMAGRKLLHDYIKTASCTLVVVSHDRTLLNLLPVVYELNKHGVSIYGGNYDFYAEQKATEANAWQQDLKSQEKALRKAREVERESLERKQKLDARGKKKQVKAGLPTISMNTFKNNAEKSTSRIKDAHAEKIESISHALGQLRKEIPDTDKIKINLDNAQLHRGKRLLEATDVNVRYRERDLWPVPLSFRIATGDRVAITGANGSGKTTLIRLMLGEISSSAGTLIQAEGKFIYIDQDYSLLNNALTVYEQVQSFNDGKLLEHELKIRLNRFLFKRLQWDKRCAMLSGGEKMRLLLCCLMISSQAPDMIILDEPTNNLDIQNIEILTAAIREYKGTLIVVSHDLYFLEQVGVEREISLR
jgi:ATPase subunit of ABC transporter with duplicated ATPase domains